MKTKVIDFEMSLMSNNQDLVLKTVDFANDTYFVYKMNDSESYSDDDASDYSFCMILADGTVANLHENLNRAEALASFFVSVMHDLTEVSVHAEQVVSIMNKEFAS